MKEKEKKGRRDNVADKRVENGENGMKKVCKGWK